MSRYTGNTQNRLDQEFYEDLLERRDRKMITHDATPILTHPTIQQRRSLQRIKHVWKTGDTLMKLAHQHYGDVTLWYVIAWYNTKPTDAHYKLGDIVYIPRPLTRVLSYLRNE